MSDVSSPKPPAERDVLVSTGETGSDAVRPLLIHEDVVAARLAISVSTLRRMRRRGEGPPPHVFGRLVRYRWSDVEDWMNRRLSA
jgi:excisionase family DNA binding protein